MGALGTSDGELWLEQGSTPYGDAIGMGHDDRYHHIIKLDLDIRTNNNPLIAIITGRRSLRMMSTMSCKSG